MVILIAIAPLLRPSPSSPDLLSKWITEGWSPKPHFICTTKALNSLLLWIFHKLMQSHQYLLKGCCPHHHQTPFLSSLDVAAVSSHSTRAQTLNHPIFHNGGLQSVRGVSLKWQYIGEKYFQPSKYTYICTSIYASSLPQLIPNLTRAHHCRMR